MSSPKDIQKRKASFISPNGTETLVKLEVTEAGANGEAQLEYDDSQLEPILKILSVDLWSNDHDHVAEKMSDLAEISPDDQNIRNQIWVYGGHLAIVGAMRKFHTFPEILSAACRALANISMGEEDHFRKAAGQVGAIQRILWAMKRFPHHRDLQTTACGALMNLFANTLNCQLAAIDLDCLDVILAAMKKFPEYPRLHRFACKAVDNLCLHEELRDRVAKTDGMMEALCKAIRTFRNEMNNDEKAIVKHARNALKTLL